MRDELNELSLEALYAELNAKGLATRLFQLARDEDLGDAGDITSRSWFADDAPLRASVSFRQEGVLAGVACIGTICDEFAPVLGETVGFEVLLNDGSEVDRGAPVAILSGSRSAVVGVERTILNTIGRLSGIATLTAKYAEEAASGNKATRLLDTRKTTPGLRVLEKYAVRCGGGYCHRIGLHDAVLVKDNHIAGMRPAELREHADRASTQARRLGASFLEIEVDSLEQFEVLLSLEPGTVDIVLLDNMRTDQLAKAVAMRNEKNPELLLEASGGVRLETIAGIAHTGVDRISVGALTHSSVALDVGLDALD